MIFRGNEAGRGSAVAIADPLQSYDISLHGILLGLEASLDEHIEVMVKVFREVWRVLKDDGRVIIVVSHRRGLWSVIDTTPFAAGRPYLKRRLEGLLRDAVFRPTVWNSALFFPPLRSGVLLRAARAWERAGSRLWPGLGGVLMLEAEKDMLAPVGLVRQEGARAVRPALAAPQPLQPRSRS